MTEKSSNPSVLTGEVESVEGLNTRLRLVKPEDAGYLYGLRTNPALNAHLSPVSGGVQEQRAWIERYKRREAAGAELYYIIERRDTGQPCGTVRLYDIGANSFTWGSWILDDNKPPKAALESAVLVYSAGFEGLGLSHAVFDVRRENERTLAFHRRFGASETGADDFNVYFTYSCDRFLADRLGHMAVLAGAI